MFQTLCRLHQEMPGNVVGRFRAGTFKKLNLRAHVFNNKPLEGSDDRTDLFINGYLQNQTSTFQ